MIVWFVCRSVSVIVVVYLFRQWRAHSDVAWSLWRVLSLAEFFMVGGIYCWWDHHTLPALLLVWSPWFASSTTGVTFEVR